MALGNGFPSSLEIPYCLGILSRKQKWYGEALEFYRRALSGKEKAFGRDELSALIFNAQGRHDDTPEQYQRAPAGRDKALSKDHPDTLKVREWLVDGSGRLAQHKGEQFENGTNRRKGI
ncbi:hypothetical protein RUND412_001000 [Rhizina undulata]